jgi:predicted transglutaminase-like cysteine proteinase
MIFSCCVRKYILFTVLSCGSTCLAQSQFVEIAYTPYDHQMERIQPVLAASSGYTFDGVSFALVNEWMIELRAMPYRYSREWQTPFEVESRRAADCKGKALALYDRLQLNGAANVRLVIGKRRVSDSLTHAWLEWDTQLGTLLLDPTFNWTVAIKVRDPRSYVAFYGYEGEHKYQATSSLLAARTIGNRNPAAPSHGVITRPVRAASRMRPGPLLFDEGPIAPSFFSYRSGF